jgi:type IV secretion system protein VirB4
MELRHAQKQDYGLKPKISATTPSQDFIPFVCHYDPNTILTKNGELLQVIKIVGFNHESISSDLINLRETVRDAISDNIKTRNFALWLHTIRRKRDISAEGEYKEYYSKKLNEDWVNSNEWESQFVNELYLTVIIEGYDTSIINSSSLMRSLSPGATKKLHEKALDEAHKSLVETVNNVLDDLDNYGANLLGLEEVSGILYSSPMQFFGKIIKLGDRNYPLAANDISDELSNYKIAFGNNSLEVINRDNKYFASMFSIKEYREVSIASLDKFLQIPQEFIITQSLDFISRNVALPHFEYQNYILEVSGDEELRYLSDLEKTIESDTKSATDYAEQQITIMLINKTIAGLDQDIKTGLERLHSLGLVTVKEDIFSQHCFWSQLPGNFQFLKRQKPITTSRVAGFASLHNFPAGSKYRNYWGDAVSIFRTVLGTPYFFNFHSGDNGHTLIAGPYGSGKTVLLNFLTCQSRKFENRLYYFDYHHSGDIFIRAIKGRYLSLSGNPKNIKALKINPLCLENNPENKAFLHKWFVSLVYWGKDMILKEELSLIPQIVDKIISTRTKQLSKAAEFFNNDKTKNIYRKLSIWHGKGKYSYIFNHETESNLLEIPVNAFNLSSVSSHKALIIPIVSYLLHKIERSLDGNKTMIVLDEAWRLVDNYLTGPKIGDWLDRLRQKNCMVIFATESIDKAGQSNITKSIMSNIATQIFLPNPEPEDSYKTVFNLNEDEFNLLPAMSEEDHHFLLKSGGDSIVASLDLSDFVDDIAVLSAGPKSLMAMKKAIKKSGEEPEKWLPEFFKIVKDKSRAPNYQ